MSRNSTEASAPMSTQSRSVLPFDTSLSACLEHGVGVFYPLAEHAHMSSKIRFLILKAKSICNTCPVREPCLEYALSNESYGIWGGMSETERQYERLERGLVYQPWKTGYGREIESANAMRARKRWRDRNDKPIRQPDPRLDKLGEQQEGTK